MKAANQGSAYHLLVLSGRDEPQVIVGTSLQKKKR